VNGLEAEHQRQEALEGDLGGLAGAGADLDVPSDHPYEELIGFEQLGDIGGEGADVGAHQVLVALRDLDAILEDTGVSAVTGGKRS